MSITTTIDKKDFECPICKNFMYEPYITTCSHRLCYDCIVRLSLESKNIAMSCPTCRKGFYSNNISKDTFMVQLMRNVEVDAPCSKKVIYNELENHQASCIQCHYYLIKQQGDLINKCIIKTFTPPVSVPVRNSSSTSTTTLPLNSLMDILYPYNN